jgi:hypothetical protein
MVIEYLPILLQKENHGHSLAVSSVGSRPVDGDNFRQEELDMNI